MESLMIRSLDKTLPTEAELTSPWTGHPKRPLVTVFCTTYNHERFISDALNGFLIQRTTFPFRIVVHDDASTDETQSIIKNHQKRYPNIMTAYIQPHNIFSQGLSPIPFVKPLLVGKYIARCEGDDYWVDPLKLQKQIKMMEANPNFSMTFHPYVVYDTRCREFESHPLRNARTATLVYRNIELGDQEHTFAGKRVINRDRVFKFLMWRHGSSGFVDSIAPAVYRRHCGGIWSGRNKHSAAIESLRTNLYIYYQLAESLPEKRWAREEVARCLARLLIVGPGPKLNVRKELGRSTTSLFKEFCRFYPGLTELKKALSKVKRQTFSG